MRKIYFILSIAASFFLSHSLAAQELAVTIGNDGPEWDACGILGKVYNLDPNGDNYLSVRAGPSAAFEAVDRLISNQFVYFCERKGRWIGIVYAPHNYPNMVCDVSSAIPHPQNYSGTCRSGWVFDEYVLPIAG